MKKLITIVAVTLVLMGAAVAGGKYFMHSMRPDLNANERIVSKGLKEDGAPDEILGQLPDVTVTKDMGCVYLSIPVNNDSLKSCKATLTYQDEQLDGCELTVSEAGYVTYKLDNLSERETGLYSVSFFNSKGEVNVYASVELKEKE